MANQRGTFAKRQREQDRKDKAKAKLERRAARRDAPRPDEKGPQIAWDEAVHANTSDDDAPPNGTPANGTPGPVPTDDAPTPSE